MTNFKYLRKVWKDNAEEERLLGVSFTGIMDHEYMSKPECRDWLIKLKQVASETNKKWAKKLRINESKQVTLVKPSGTVSQLCGTSSGIHPRYSPYYIRRVTQDIADPLTQLMIDEGVPYVEDRGKILFSFYKKSPPSSVVEMSTKEQLDLWLVYREYWCDGNPSQTIYYTDDSFLEIQQWVWKNWDKIGGLSFFPKDDNIYENAPFEEIGEREYEDAISKFPVINWERLSEYELEDTTTTEVAAACSGSNCEL